MAANWKLNAVPAMVLLSGRGVATVGASLTAATLTVCVLPALLIVPSFTTKLTVRVVVSGFSEVFK